MGLPTVTIYKLRYRDFPHWLDSKTLEGPPPTPHTHLHIWAAECVFLWVGGNHRVGCQGPKLPRSHPTSIFSRASPKWMALGTENDTAERKTLLVQGLRQRVWSWFHFQGTLACFQPAAPMKQMAWVSLTAELGWWPQKATSGLGAGAVSKQFPF